MQPETAPDTSTSDPWPLLHLADLSIRLSDLPSLAAYQLALAPLSTDWPSDDNAAAALMKRVTKLWRQRREKSRARQGGAIGCFAKQSGSERFPLIECIDLGWTLSRETLPGLTSAQLVATLFHPNATKDLVGDASDIFFSRREKSFAAGERLPELLPPLSSPRFKPGPVLPPFKDHPSPSPRLKSHSITPRSPSKVDRPPPEPPAAVEKSAPDPLGPDVTADSNSPKHGLPPRPSFDFREPDEQPRRTSSKREREPEDPTDAHRRPRSVSPQGPTPRPDSTQAHSWPSRSRTTFALSLQSNLRAPVPPPRPISPQRLNFGAIPLSVSKPPQFAGRTLLPDAALPPDLRDTLTVIYLALPRQATLDDVRRLLLSSHQIAPVGVKMFTAPAPDHRSVSAFAAYLLRRDARVVVERVAGHRFLGETAWAELAKKPLADPGRPTGVWKWSQIDPQFRQEWEAGLTRLPTPTFAAQEPLAPPASFKPTTLRPAASYAPRHLTYGLSQLFVSNLPADISISAAQDFFDRFDGLVGISLGKPNLKWRNCAAWLLFQTGATLRACRAEIEDTRYPGMNVTLYFEDCNRESHSKHRREWLWLELTREFRREHRTPQDDQPAHSPKTGSSTTTPLKSFTSISASDPQTQSHAPEKLIHGAVLTPSGVPGPSSSLLVDYNLAPAYSNSNSDVNGYRNGYIHRATGSLPPQKRHPTASVSTFPASRIPAHTSETRNHTTQLPTQTLSTATDLPTQVPTGPPPRRRPTATSCLTPSPHPADPIEPAKVEPEQQSDHGWNNSWSDDEDEQMELGTPKVGEEGGVDPVKLLEALEKAVK